MKYSSWVQFRAGRLLGILAAIIIYAGLLALDISSFFNKNGHFDNLPLLQLRLGLSTFIALLFLTVGTLIWLYARDRRVAGILYFFSVSMMITFSAEIGAFLGNAFLYALGVASGVIGLLFLSSLLLLFPRNYFELSPQISTSQSVISRQSLASWIARGYIVILACLGIIVTFLFFPLNVEQIQVPVWLETLGFAYYGLGFAGSLVTIILTYRYTPSLRKRQQLRIFVGGVIIALAPLLFLTVLPTLLGLPSQFVIDGQYSSISAGFLPLVLGYSLLRYQFLIFDAYIRRAVVWMLGVLGLVIVSYLVVVVSSLLFSSNIVMQIAMITLMMAVFAPLTWWLMSLLADGLFFSELAYYRRLIDKPGAIGDETFDLNGAAKLFSTSFIDTFATQEVCLFVLDQDTGYYQLSPETHEEESQNDPRQRLADYFLGEVKKVSSDETRERNIPDAVMIGTNWLESNHIIVERVDGARRPLLLSEAVRSEKDRPIGLRRYLTSTVPLGRVDPLLVPVRSQGKMIALVVLGERGDHEQFAGPDFDVIELLLTLYSSVLENARLYAASSRYTAILNTLYKVTASPDQSFETISEVATAFAEIAAQATHAGAELWLFNKKRLLKRVVHEGSGPMLLQAESMTVPEGEDKIPCFYEGSGSFRLASSTSTQSVPTYFTESPRFPFAWLPLERENYRLGFLALTYPRPHLFANEEMRVLQMFANQCAATLENTRITLELREAYEQQKELDRLKDQFIMTTSHELRTPLTAVQGYLELLSEHYQSLPQEKITEFIVKANRGCEELTLLVGNITEAGRIEVDVEKAKLNLSPVSLADIVNNVAEILGATFEREDRSLKIEVPATLLVFAEAFSLRQVLLNLLMNAIRYSSSGSRIEITGNIDGEGAFARLSIRDYGLGIPPEQVQTLFKRFARLERDMNSPQRGAGLGLYICKRLIEAMDGNIWLESSGVEGEGTCVNFRLKLAPGSFQNTEATASSFIAKI